jgi:hypothetical protein
MNSLDIQVLVWPCPTAAQALTRSALTPRDFAVIRASQRVLPEPARSVADTTDSSVVVVPMCA